MHGLDLLVQVYISIYHSDRLSTFGIYISRRLDGARTGGCSHLPIVDEKHRGL